MEMKGECTSTSSRTLLTVINYHAQAFIRRGLDIFIAFCLLVGLSPLYFCIVLLVAMDGGPVLYRHARIGLNGKSFGCWKFRTMVTDAQLCLSEYLQLHPDLKTEWEREVKLKFDPRVTGAGSMLRKLSFDELPQLWNVLVGQMSLVGPRPVTEGELRDKYCAEAKLITSVKPGLTGLWQVSGRNGVAYQQRIALDVLYVRSRNILLDMSILARTPRSILSRAGAY